jgi:hypothetical protein
MGQRLPKASPLPDGGSVLRAAALFLSAPLFLSAQAPRQDEGRLDPAWFGAQAAFQPSKMLGFQWLKPGLDLRRRSLRPATWEPDAWLLGRRVTKDMQVARRFAEVRAEALAKGLGRSLGAALPISASTGDLRLVGRLVDAVGDPGDGISFGASSLTFDLKLVDGDSGELLGAFHDTLKILSPDQLPTQVQGWFEALGRELLPFASAKEPSSAPAAEPAYDLEGALRRIEALRRDGLIGEEEYRALRKKALERGKGL